MGVAIGDGKSVLLLGAGVSAPFNLPLGSGMIDAIVNQIEAERATLRASSGRVTNMTMVGEALSDASVFYKIPIHATIGLRAKNIENNRFVSEEFLRDMDMLLHLQALLRNQTSDSIDDFVVQNPGLSAVSKIAIAAIIFLRCYENSTNGYSATLRPLAARYTDQMFSRRASMEARSERNWVHLLINIARDKYFRGKPDPDKRIRVITFNYDMILEHILEAQFQNTEYQYGSYTEYFDILHVHGRCGRLEVEIRSNLSALVQTWAQGIHVVRDDSVSGEVEAARSLAREWIAKARNIHSVGFAFARANVSLLGLDQCESTSTLNFCNYDRSVGVKKNAEKCRVRFRKVVEDCNEDDRPLRVSDWFATGYAGELPS